MPGNEFAAGSVPGAAVSAAVWLEAVAPSVETAGCNNETDETAAFSGKATNASCDGAAGAELFVGTGGARIGGATGSCRVELAAETAGTRLVDGTAACGGEASTAETS